MKRRLSLLGSLALSAAALSVSSPAFARAQITIVNVNAPGVGFNDPTPATPSGGNPGTTLGQQRLIAFQYAASLWEQVLDSNVEIRIQASFEPRTCTATTAVLGSAGPINVFRDFQGAEHPGTWYHIALANKLARTDLIPSDPASGTGDDIRARFNSDLGQPNCLAGSSWYYGLDAHHPPSTIDLVTVLLHEFGHGLGFSTVASGLTGALLAGYGDTYSRLLYDNTLRKSWPEMTDAERRFSALNSRRIAWTGAEVTAAVPRTLNVGTASLTVEAPSSIAGEFAVGTASFGPQLTADGISGVIVAARDAANSAGPSVNDGCSAILNAPEVTGRIALVDRGTCPFATKVYNAQLAGAVAVIVADNAPGNPPPGLGGADPRVSIPSVRITQGDGATLRAQLSAGVRARLGLNLALRAGADANGRALVNAPDPYQSGSSVSHWDPVALPNLLMEPAINDDLPHGLDLTTPQMRDIGWYPDGDLDGVADAVDQCKNTNLGQSTVAIQGCDSGVSNTLFQSGCTVSDLVGLCASGAGNHGGYASCVSNLGNELKSQGLISGAQKGALQSCAAQASAP